MTKRLRSHWYSIQKMTHDKERHLKVVQSDDGTLFSCGIYPTKIKKEDLPEWYIYGRYYKLFGYLCAKGVVDLKYRPSKFSDHLFKDDFLFISYSSKIEPDLPDRWFKGHDEYISGSDIVTFIKAVEKYSDFDVTDIKKEIEEKVVYWNNNFADEHHPKVKDVWNYF